MELKEKLLSSFMAFEEKIDVHSELHDLRTSAIKNFENKGFPTKKIQLNSRMLRNISSTK
jgi:Fe-S cluster assembly protein SufD